MGFHRGPKIVTDGLVLYLDAANTKSYPGSGTTWSDLSGNGNNGALINGPTFDSGNNGSIVFDGVDDYAVLPYDTTLNSDYTTMSVWIKSSYLIGPVTRHYIFDGLQHYRMIYVDEPYEINFVVRVNYIFIANRVNVPSIVNKWTNITGSYDGDTINLYVNGTLIDSQPGPGLPIDSASTDGRLMDYIGNGYETEGLTSIFMMYNRALTGQEIQQNYNATKSRFNL